MRLLFPCILLSSLVFSQDVDKVSGIVANGVTYTYQFMDVKNDIPLTDLDTIQGEFQVIVSETQKFIKILGIEDIDSIFDFDSMVFENLLENEYIGEMLEMLHYTQRAEIDFELDYIDEIVKGEKHPIIVKWMYDDVWNSVKLYATYTQNGVNHFYNFYFDEVTYIGWEHGLTYSKEYSIDIYGETSTQNDEETPIFEAKDEATFIVNDTSLIITSDRINLEKTITRSFSSPEKDIYMVAGALFSIPKRAKYIFYSFDYNESVARFDGYYYFGIKEE